MTVLRLVLLFLHFLGLAGLIGGFVAQVRGPARRITMPILAGALVMLVTGPALIAVDTGLDRAVNDPKMIVKLVVLLVITVPALVFRRRTLAPTVFFGLSGLCVAEVAVAVFWA